MRGSAGKQGARFAGIQVGRQAVEKMRHFPVSYSMCLYGVDDQDTKDIKKE